MNTAHAHLVIVHLPIVLTPVAALIIYVGLKKNRPDVITTALLLFVVAAVGCVAAYLTGEGAEELLEHAPGIAESKIESHEEAAMFGLIAVLVTGLASAVALLMERIIGVRSHVLLKLIFALAVVSSASLAWTGKLGGVIRHPEIEQTAISRAE